MSLKRWLLKGEVASAVAVVKRTKTTDNINTEDSTTVEVTAPIFLPASQKDPELSSDNQAHSPANPMLLDQKSKNNSDESDVDDPDLTCSKKCSGLLTGGDSKNDSDFCKRFSLPKQKISKKCLTFQERWLEQFPWLTTKPRVGALCKICLHVYNDEKCKLMNQRLDLAFVSGGFTNWKKALERFPSHEKSSAHIFAVNQAKHEKRSAPINVQLSARAEEQQKNNFRCLTKIISGIQYLARQGIAVRGHTDDDGNFKQLLCLLAADDEGLEFWLDRRRSWTSHDMQNEMLDIMSKNIVTDICGEVRKQGCFAIVVDGTQDVAGVDQQSICIRYVDDELKPKEEFVGFYSTSSFTGQSLANVILDALLRLQLPLEKLRGQTYDGASNMSGIYNGAQAWITQKQPLAIFVHCTAHITNLVSVSVTKASLTASNAMSYVNDLGVLLGKSGKFKTILQEIAQAETGGPPSSIKPLCPTRWLARCAPMRATIGQYKTVLAALKEISHSNPIANGLLDRFEEGTTVLGLSMALEILSPLENLNRSLQSSSQTVSGAMLAVDFVKEHLSTMRSDEAFQKVFSKASEIVEEHDLAPLTLPRRRKPPKCLTGDGECYHADEPFSFYKVQFFEMLDTATSQLKERFQKDGMKKFAEMEDCLLKGTDNGVLDAYPEFNNGMLHTQLSMFKCNYEYANLHDISQILSNMVPEVRRLFPDIERVVRLLLTIPASSCEAERSFSSLRRLKTYLRSTMTQKRLNSLAVCHVHQDKLDVLKSSKVAEEFVKNNESRQAVFGKIRNV